MREIPAKHSSLSGVINTGQIKKSLQFESSLERDFIYLLEFDIEVDEYIEQPLVITYRDENNKLRSYTPDFAISYHGDDRVNEIVEIKYQSTLNSKYKELIRKFKAAEKYCKKNGYTFRIVTDKFIRIEREIELENYKFLSRYRDYFSKVDKSKAAFPSVNNDVEMIYTAMHKLKETTITGLAESCARDHEKKCELIFLIWYLVASGFIAADFSKKLTLNTTLWLY